MIIIRTMEMLDTNLILMLKLFQLLLRCLFIVLLILLRRLNRRIDFLTDEQNLAVLVVEVLWLDL